MRKSVRAALGVAAMMAMTGLCGVTKAQELSADADMAMWCGVAINYLLDKGAFSEEGRPVAEAAMSFHAENLGGLAQIEGISTERLNELAASYADEIVMQVDDFLINRDKAALRFDIDGCLAVGQVPGGGSGD